jgi:hypothetical protein
VQWQIELPILKLRFAAAFEPILRRSTGFKPNQQPGELLLRPVVPHGNRQRLPLADDHHQTLTPRDGADNQGRDRANEPDDQVRSDSSRSRGLPLGGAAVARNSAW